MLSDFVNDNRHELIRRCRAKSAARQSPPIVSDAIDHGVPQFLQQLIDALRIAEGVTREEKRATEPNAHPTAIGRSAALHGADLMRSGYNADQVVHGYGDVCQAITEMAIEKHSAVGTDEFRILNLSLDNAIADAVTAFGLAHHGTATSQAEAEDKRLRGFADEQRKLTDIALQSYSAIQTGNIGLTGATGALLIHALTELRELAERIQQDSHRVSVNGLSTKQ